METPTEYLMRHHGIRITPEQEVELLRIANAYTAAGMRGDFFTTVSRAMRGRNLRPDEPCGHDGCLSHVTHPCEGCGRIAGRWPKYEAAP